MSIQIEVSAKFQGSHRQSGDCFDTTDEETFWLYDPPQETGEPAKLLILQEGTTCLKVEKIHRFPVNFWAIDNCLLPRGAKKCDCLLFFGERKETLYWVELKMETTDKSKMGNKLALNVIKKIVMGNLGVGGDEQGAIHQILSARGQFTEKGIDLTRYSEKAHIGLPQHTEQLQGMSQSLQQFIRRQQKENGLTVTIGSTLQLR